MTLIEVLTVVAMLGAVSVVFSALFATLVRDIPRSGRAMDVNSIVSSMLLEMRKDAASARSLPAVAGQARASEKMLLLQLHDGVICYELKDGKVIKRRTGLDGKVIASRTWPVPNAKIRWTVWQRAGRRYAVEVRTCVEVIVAGRRREKLANARVFFPGSAPAGSAE